MLKSIIWYCKFVMSLIAKIPAMKKAEQILKSGDQQAFDRFVYDTTTDWAMDRIRDSGARITVHNQEKIPKEQNVLFVSNHQSDFDIAIFIAMIPKDTGFIAKVELEKVPLLNTWMKYIHCVFMDRKDLKQSLQTILDGIQNLKKGYSMVVFPEGTRSKSSKMGEFKAGSFKLATKSKVPIVPVTMDGSYKIMEGNHHMIKAADVDVFIHDPIYVNQLSKEELSGLPEKVQAIIQSAIHDKP